MKKYKYLLGTTLVSAALMCTTTSCRDDFSEINQDPSTVTKADPSFLFAQGILEFEPSGYTYWFYNAAQFYQWIQYGVATSGVSSTLAEGGTAPGFSSISVWKYANELKYVRSVMDPEESAKYSQYQAGLDIISVYMGLFDSDFIGNIPFTEAANASHGGTLTPKYDSVESLYTLWLTMLDDAIKTFTSNDKNQIFEGSQDVVYNGKTEKWAKLANSIKLKIAARMLSQNKAKALSLAEEVANASCGVLDGTADDFLFNKATYNSSSNDHAYHWSNGILTSVGASQSFMDFMLSNHDPRIRFIYKKNEWNSKIVQLFFNDKKQDNIPSYIMDNIDYTIGADGIYQFKGWKGAGEPWVRYYGLPLAFDAGLQESTYGDWFNYKNKCTFGSKSYRPYSMFQDEMIYGRVDFTLPTTPDDPTIQDIEDQPWYGMYLTTAEVNLYLAEFKLLGANLPASAESYFNKAIKSSVEEYDRVAGLNKIPYYGTTYNYDPNEKVIDLQSGEIETMMSNKSYQLTGNKADDLEKVYIQQLIHFSLLPIDQFVTARRSGIPKLSSSILKRVDYTQVPVTNIPRRVAISAPSPTDLMHDILIQSYKDQGYTIGSGSVLNTERVWQDQGAPQWGAGPVF